MQNLDCQEICNPNVMSNQMNKVTRPVILFVTISYAEQGDVKINERYDSVAEHISYEILSSTFL